VAAGAAHTSGPCMDPPLGPSLETVRTNELQQQKTPENGSANSADIKEASCKGDGARKSSDIVTRMKRRPQCEKPTVVHGTLYTKSNLAVGSTEEAERQ